MKVYTKTGDSGETGLFGGERVAKDDIRLRAYGVVDELNAVVGWLRAVDLDVDIDQLLQQVQYRLFDLGAELATPQVELLAGKSHRVELADIEILEQAIDEWDQELSPLKAFILPGGCDGAARAHIVRTVVRRAERHVVSLAREQDISDILVKYLNRLSDFVFVLARIINHRAGVADVEWNQSQ